MLHLTALLLLSVCGGRSLLRYDCAILYLDCDRDTLYKRLDGRVDEMVRAGIVQEVWRFATHNGLLAGTTEQGGAGAAVGKEGAGSEGVRGGSANEADGVAVDSADAGTEHKDDAANGVGADVVDNTERRGNGGCGDNTANTASTTGGDDTSSEFPGVAKSIGFKEFWPYLQHLWSSVATEVASSTASATVAAAAEAAVMYPDVEIVMQQHVDAFLSGEVGVSEAPTKASSSSSSSLSSSASSSSSSVAAGEASATATTQAGASCEGGAAVLAQCVEQLKRSTRRYAKRQCTWARNRLPKMKEVHMLRLDTTDVSKWSAAVSEPAVAFVDAFLRGAPRMKRGRDGAGGGAGGGVGGVEGSGEGDGVEGEEGGAGGSVEWKKYQYVWD